MTQAQAKKRVQELFGESYTVGSSRRRFGPSCKSVLVMYTDFICDEVTSGPSWDLVISEAIMKLTPEVRREHQRIAAETQKEYPRRASL